ncbi:MAG: PQQ-dependent sugar dehydrogenase [Microlunatus sp.]
MPRRNLRALLSSLLLAAIVTFTGSFALPSASAAPTLTVTKVASSRTIPWDVTWIGSLMLFDQRGGGIWSQRGTAGPKRVSMALPKIYAKGESGMLGVVADPKASSNKYFYTCMAVATSKGKAKDIEVWKWRLTSDTSAKKVKVLVKGIPLSSKGRHSGCRLRFRSPKMLYIGTGDTATGTVPQNLKSLGGKVLRVRSSGSIPKSNPFYAKGGKARYIWTYGHRNVQGLAFRPGSGQMWSVEHGTSRDDEINLLAKGANYGWCPTPGYNERRSMTDKKRFPSAHSAKWSSGQSTVATSGAAFLTGKQWGTWNGRLAVAMLKGEGVKVFTLSGNTITAEETILTSYGRIRTVQQGPDGALYFATSNGSGQDGIYRVTRR